MVRFRHKKRQPLRNALGIYMIESLAIYKPPLMRRYSQRSQRWKVKTLTSQPLGYTPQLLPGSAIPFVPRYEPLDIARMF